MQQNYKTWRSFLLLLLVFLGGVCKVSATDVLKGSSVYVRTGSSALSSLGNANLTFTVLTAAEENKPGTVSVQPSSNASFSGALTIPSVIYSTSSSNSTYYNVTTIDASAFQDKEGITDLFFSRDFYYGYQLTTIGANAFSDIPSLTGTIHLPATVTSIGDNAFALPSGSPVTVDNVVMDVNSKGKTTTLSFGKTVFANRTITNLHVFNNFSYATYAADQTFNNSNVTNLYYYGDGTTSSNQGDGDEGYYKFLSTTLAAHTTFKPIGKNLYIPGDDVKNFVTQCTNNNHSVWIPETVNCLTFDKTTDEGTYTLMLKSSNTSEGGYEVALHGAKINESVKDLKLDFRSWDIDMFPTPTGQNGHVTQIDSKAFAGNDNLQSITITPYSSKTPCELEGNAFQGLPSLRYLDLSNKNITMAFGYTLSRIPTTKSDESVAYKYTKSTSTFDCELSNTVPFGGVPAYTLVFMPQNTISYPTTTTTETVNKTDGSASNWTRPVDENFMLYNNGSWYCNNFGVYDVPELNSATVSGQSYSNYSWSTPKDIDVKKSTFYRQFKAGVPSSVCLPFAPDKPEGATLYTFGSSDGKSVTLTSVDTPKANTPYFIRPTADTQLTSSKEQTISSTAKLSNTDNMHGVYTGQSMSNVSNAYGMAANAFTSNGVTYPAGTFVKLSSSAYINPFRAYLTLSSATAKVLRLVTNDTPTGIAQSTLEDNNAAPYYNLQGMKTAKPSHGIYIHNGRKVIVK